MRLDEQRNEYQKIRICSYEPEEDLSFCGHKQAWRGGDQLEQMHTELKVANLDSGRERNRLKI